MWDLPRLGIKPLSSVLAGGFLLNHWTTRKPKMLLLMLSTLLDLPLPGVCDVTWDNIVMIKREKCGPSGL